MAANNRSLKRNIGVLTLFLLIIVAVSDVTYAFAR